MNNEPISRRDSAACLPDYKPWKKILIVCSHYWPSSGGVESRMEQFSVSLAAAGYLVTVLTHVFPGRDTDLRKGVHILSVTGAAMRDAIRQAVASGEYAVCILVQDPLGGIIWSVEGLDVPASTRLFIQPIINEDGYARWQAHPAFPVRLAAILKSASAALTMTRSGPDTRFMARMGIDSVYLPNATLPAQPAGDFRLRYAIPRERFLILHVANLYWVKNHIGLMDALQDMPSAWQLVMIGHPSGEHDCAQAVRDKIATRPDILFIPGLSREWVAAAMRDADLVVLSSLGEGSPNTILEAMSLGKPWLATPECGAVHDHMGGVIQSLDRFSAVIATLAADRGLTTALADLGQRHWRQCYSWPVVIQGWIDLIEQCHLQRQFVADTFMADAMRDLRARVLARKGRTATPRVSVILFVRDGGAALARSLASLSEQSLAPMEVIVAASAGRIKEQSVRILPGGEGAHFLALGPQAMVAGVMNAALRLAGGDYIAFLEEGDVFLQQHLRLATDALLRAGYRHACVAATPVDGVASGREAVLSERPVSFSSWVFERQCASQAGAFDSSLGGMCAWDWLIRLVQQAEVFRVTEPTLCLGAGPSDCPVVELERLDDALTSCQRIYAMHPAQSLEIATARIAYLARGFAQCQETAKEVMAIVQPVLGVLEHLGILELIDMAEKLVALRAFDTAIGLYRSWFGSNHAPMRFAAAYNLGVILQTVGQHAAAADEFRRALGFNPDCDQARFALALLLENAGCWGEAMAHWRQLGSGDDHEPGKNLHIHELAVRKVQQCDAGYG